MPLLSALDTFSLSTGTVGTTQVRSIGFQPKVLISWAQNVTASTVESENASLCFGVALSASDRSYVATWMQTGSTTSDSSAAVGDSATDRLFGTVTDPGGGGARIGSWDVNSIDAGGYTVIVDSQDVTVACGAQVLCLGGTGLSNVYQGVVSFPNSTQSVSITGVPFTPDAILFFTEGFAGFHFGAAARVGGGQGCSASLHDEAGSINTTEYSYSKSDRCYAYLGIGADTVRGSATVSSWNSDGVTLAWTKHSGANSAANSARYVAFKMGAGFGARVLTGSTNTGNGASVVLSADAGFTPRAGMVFSSGRGESTGTTPDDDWSGSIGGFSGTTQAACAYMDPKGGSTSTVLASRSTSSVYSRLNTTPINAEYGRMSVTSLTRGAINCTMDDGDPTSALVWSLVFGELPAVRGSPIFF